MSQHSAKGDRKRGLLLRSLSAMTDAELEEAERHECTRCSMSVDPIPDAGGGHLFYDPDRDSSEHCEGPVVSGWFIRRPS